MKRNPNPALPRYTIAFYVDAFNEEPRAPPIYVVRYVPDPATGAARSTLSLLRRLARTSFTESSERRQKSHRESACLRMKSPVRWQDHSGA